MSRLKTVTLAVAVALAFTLVGCTAQPPAPEEPQIDLAAEEAAVRAVNAKWLELSRAKDADGIGALFVADAWTLSGTEGLSEGQEAIIANARKGFEENPDAVSDWGAKDVWVSASADLAVERGWYSVDEDGEGEKDVIQGEYITVFTKVGGEWKVVADSSVPVVVEVMEE